MWYINQNFPRSAFFTLHTLCFPPYCLTFHQRGTKTCLCQDRGFHWVPVVCLETRIIRYHGALWSPCCNLAVISNSSWIEGRTTLWIILFGVDPRISLKIRDELLWKVISWFLCVFWWGVYKDNSLKNYPLEQAYVSILYLWANSKKVSFLFNNVGANWRKQLKLSCP